MKVHDADLSEQSSILSNLIEPQQQRLTEILDRYLCGLEKGEALDTEALKQEHPDLADALAAYFQKLDALHGIAAGFQSTGVEIGTFDLGDFSIGRELGRGGMGIVYEARQRSLDRRVALKLLPLAAVLDSRQIARFKNESQAAGQLQHPNIVPVYSFGIERGIHFYVMQLIEGKPIDLWIADQRESGSLADWQYVVQLAIDAADALQCAHETGIVHRDIKPSNLLLEDHGHIWITDFGLARCQNDVSLTLSGDLLGTMRYMSPEQASGRTVLVDHRTDIYSLAATLFEMLTLQPAVAGDDGAALLRAIDRDGPPRLSKYRCDVPSDLNVVLQKAMAKQKDQRYASAQQFADDMRAVLEGRPTVARPPSLASLAGRYAVRHRKIVAAGSSVLTVAMAWLLISSAIILQKNHDARTSASDAERYLHQARATVDDLGSRVAEQLASVPGAEHVRQSLLTQTLQYYEDFVAQATGDPKLQAELAVTHNRIGSLMNELKSPADALPHFQQSAIIFDRLAKETRLAPDARHQMAQNWNHLGLALAALGHFESAATTYQKAIAAQRRILSEQPDDAACETELALTTNNLALLLQDLGKDTMAKELFEDATARLTRIVQSDPDNYLATRGLAAALGNSSTLLLATEPQLAIRLLQQAIDLQLSAAADHSSNRLRASAEIAKIYNNLGAAYSQTKAFANAEKAFSNAITLGRQLRSIAPLVDQHRSDLAMSLNNLGMVLQKSSQHSRAETSLREAIDLQQSCLDRRSVDPRANSRLGAMLHNLAASLSAMGRDREANALLQSAISQQKTALLHAPEDTQTRSHLLQHYSHLLRCQIRVGQYHAAEVTSAAYRKTADGKPQELMRVAIDLAEATQRIPSGQQRERSVSATAAALGSARDAGLKLDPSLLKREPFLALTHEPRLRKVLQP